MSEYQLQIANHEIKLEGEGNALIFRRNITREQAREIRNYLLRKGQPEMDKANEVLGESLPGHALGRRPPRFRSGGR